MTLGSILILLLLIWILTHTFFSSFIGLLFAVIIWGLTGLVAGNIVGGRFTGLGYIALGLAGGLVGGALIRLLGLKFILGLPLGIGVLLTGVLGAVVFVAVMRFVFDSKFAR